jgi:chromosome segregation ATPase
MTKEEIDKLLEEAEAHIERIPFREQEQRLMRGLIQAVRELHEAANEDYSDDMATMLEQKTEWQNKCAELESKIATKDMQIAELRDDRNRWADAMTQSHITNGELAVENVDFRTRIAELEQQNAELQAELVNCE